MLARALALVLAILLIGAAPASRRPPASEQAPAKLQKYEGRYYIIHTDLAGDELREAELRMAKMAVEYHERTREFSGSVTRKFPFFMYRNAEDYYRAGGKEGSAGFFDRNTNTLVAIAGKKLTDYTWSVVQHEGFHQFAANVIGGELPIWVNEGLAEYFGEGIFTGDGFVTGVIPPQRLQRIKQQMQRKSFRPIKEMMLLAHRDWNDQLSMENYDQAWSMVQFLAHGENGRYAPSFVSFMRAIGAGVQWPKAWIDAFGSAEGFEQRWRDYWLKLPDNPTGDLYARAVVAIATGVLARGTAAKQRFAGFNDLADAVEKKSIEIDERDWLPPALVAGGFDAAKKMRASGVGIELTPSTRANPPAIVCTLRDGRKLVGRFTLKKGLVEEVTVESPGR